MKALCCICSDQFDDASAVAAIACGHTFHYLCLQRWISTKNTCPHCRKPVQQHLIIPKLFFDKVDESDSTPDPGRVVNELSDLRVTLRQVENERNASIQNLNAVQQSLSEIIDSQTASERKLRREEAHSASLRTKLTQLETQNNALMEERVERDRVKARMASMEMVERVLNESERGMREILSQQHGEAQLATLCAALKREFDRTKQEKRELKTELDESRRKLIVKGQRQNEAHNTVESLRSQLKRSEDDLKILERERDLLKRTNEQLKKSARLADINTMKSCRNGIVLDDETDPSPTVSSLSDKSPTAVRRDLAKNAFTPPLFGDESIDRGSDSDESLVEFFPTEEIKTPEVAESFKSRLKRECENIDVSFVEFSKPPEVENRKRKIEQAEHMPLTSLNIFKNMKKKGFCDYNSAIRTNYNGLGGHSRFTQVSRSQATHKTGKGTLSHFLNKYS